MNTDKEIMGGIKINMDQSQVVGLEQDQISKRIIGCCFRVSNTLGNGFMEKVYENALVYELQKDGLKIAQQQPITVWYEGIIVGDFFADIVVENEILVELKAARALDDIHQAQCLNYLKATGYKVCLLINFGTPKVQIKRLIR
jgi:GxxExxY protein